MIMELLYSSLILFFFNKEGGWSFVPLSKGVQSKGLLRSSSLIPFLADQQVLGERVRFSMSCERGAGDPTNDYGAII